MLVRWNSRIRCSLFAACAEAGIRGLDAQFLASMLTHAVKKHIGVMIFGLIVMCTQIVLLMPNTVLCLDQVGPSSP